MAILALQKYPLRHFLRAKLITEFYGNMVAFYGGAKGRTARPNAQASLPDQAEPLYVQPLSPARSKLPLKLRDVPFLRGAVRWRGLLCGGLLPS